ncbi:MAG TPA: hypothetical protein DIS79_02480 [Bacteroidetes bacterium]|nr:hypothetical protein [Bacteroidota bacterium]
MVEFDSAVQTLRVRSVRSRQLRALGWVDTSLVALEEEYFLRVDTSWRVTSNRSLFQEVIVISENRGFNGFLFGQYIVRDDTAFHVSTDDGRTWKTVVGFPRLQLGENSHTADVIFIRRQDTLWFCKRDLKVITTTHPPGVGTYTLHVIDNRTFSIRDGSVYEFHDNGWIFREELDILPGYVLKNTHQALYGVDSESVPFRWSPTTGILRLYTTRISSPEVLVSDPYVVFTDSSLRYLVYKEQTITSSEYPERPAPFHLVESVLITDDMFDVSQYVPQQFLASTPPTVTIHAVTGETVLNERDSWLVRTDSLPRGVYVVTITNRETNSTVDVLIMKE